MAHRKVPSLEQSISFAATCHEGQIDKMGQPYIMHPMRVMLMLLTFVERTVAILHDVVEDCDVTLEQLAEMGYPGVILEAVDSVTKREGEAYHEFIRRSAKNPTGMKVKKADLLDNISPIRRYNLAPDHRARLHIKYSQALEILRVEELKMAEEDI